MKITRDRNLNSLEFSYLSSSNFLDQLGSWVFPPYAIAEGWYYFGSVITLLIIYFLFVTFFQKSNSKEKLFVYFFIIFFLISFQFAAAKSSLIFDFFWEKFEFLRNFRIWSRMNIILVPIISILVALSLKKIENFPEEKLEFKKHILIFFSLALLILVVQIYLIEFHNVNNYFWETWQMKRLDFVMEKIKIFSWLINLYNNYIYAIFLIISVISVLSLIVLQKKNLIIYCVAMLVVSELFFISNIQWAIPKNHYNHKEYNYFSSKPMIELRNAFIKPSISTVVKGNTYFRNERNFNINYFDVFGIETHTRIFDSYLNRKGEFKENVSIKDRELVNKFYFLDGSGKRAFFSKSLNHENLMEFISDADQTEIENNVKINIEIDTYTGDEIHINVENEIGGYLTLIDNWAPGWIGKVNGEEVRLEKLFNTYKSVKLNSGKNKVYLKYNPW